jgi:fumarate reductase subunit C
MSHDRYRNYVLFAFTSVFMGIAAILLLQGVRALGQGEVAWNGYLASMGSAPMRVLNILVLGFTVYFTIRWAWLSRKIGAGRVGPIPGPGLPLPVLFGGLLAAFIAGFVVTLMLLGGAL